MSTKQVLMDLEEYNKELNDSFTKGFGQGRTQMSNVVHTILKKTGEITVDEKAEPEIKAFVELLNKVADLLPDGALNEQTDTETSGSDQKLPDEGPSEGNV